MTTNAARVVNNLGPLNGSGLFEHFGSQSLWMSAEYITFEADPPIFTDYTD